MQLHRLVARTSIENVPSIRGLTKLGFKKEGILRDYYCRQTGEWFDYITGESITVDNTSHEVNMLPGEFRIYTSTKVSEGFGDIVNVYSGVVTSIEDELPNFTYYPNPTTGKLYFKGEVPGRLKAVEMVDMQGNSAFSVGVENNQLEAIDVSGTKPGLYLLHLITETKKYTLKVMVKH